MKMNRHRLPVTALLAIVVSSLFLSQCGYSLHRRAMLPFNEIRIGSIENKTFEPKLQDMLHRALLDEFRSQGIRVSPEAKLTLSGVVRKFSMLGVAEKGDVINEYQMNILADFMLTDATGTVKEFKNISPPFIVNATGSGEFVTLIGNREIAEERAMRDLALQIVGALIYQ